jgi:hypothetical protein
MKSITERIKNGEIDAKTARPLIFELSAKYPFLLLSEREKKLETLPPLIVAMIEEKQTRDKEEAKRQAQIRMQQLEAERARKLEEERLAEEAKKKGEKGVSNSDQSDEKDTNANANPFDAVGSFFMSMYICRS